MANITGSSNLDVELMFPGLRSPVTVGPQLRLTGWRGGYWLQYVDGGSQDFVVEISDGNHVAGFFVFASPNYRVQPPRLGATPGSEANWLSEDPQQSPGVQTMFCDNTRAYFKFYETVPLSGGTRTTGTITYSLHDILKVSENGLLCNDSDFELDLAGVTTPVEVGIVSAVPSAINGNRLGADLKY